MNKYSVDSIRKSFIEFFEGKNHLAAHSFPLIPKNDNTLLLVNAGMAPLKRYFTGADTPPNKRMVTCQKCVRTGDIENVGYTSRHCTFFEMLGNFSFGDYFKNEAIQWAWEFMTETMGIDKEKLWASVYFEDDEAYDIWLNKIHIPEERIVKLGKKDNFWELEVGPSGPCSEIYYDRGPVYSCGDENCKPGCDCDRYVEVWNLVFTQFDKDASGNYHLLSNPNIDTGMGLERMATVLQGKENVFEIEPLISVINKIESISGKKYGEDKKTDISIRIITDHTRAVTFLIGDGVIPSNEGRGYVLRRLLRRASRHGRLLGITENFMTIVSKLIIELWGKAYPELENSKEQVFKIIEIEEDKFSKTIDLGFEILNDFITELKNNNKSILSGEKAFKLYDTFGFPIELTEEILSEIGLNVDKKDYLEFMDKQKSNARNAREASSTDAWIGTDFKIEDVEPTNFQGYEHDRVAAKIIKLYDIDYNEVEFLEKEGFAVTDNTVLYAESGGQKGDRGNFSNENTEVDVVDVTKANNNIFLHSIKIRKNILKVGDTINVFLNNKDRLMTSSNHTATHLLHEALRNVLGKHVNQSGSLVENDRLRFDFSHFDGLTVEELNQVENLVNANIFNGLNVSINYMSLEDAKKNGITALFDSKYGEYVRVVNLEDYSRELCGGTHVSNTSQIGMFKIISETGIASGVRRIEAITGMHAFNFLNGYQKKYIDISKILKTSPENIENRINQLLQENKEKEKIILNYKNEENNQKLNTLVDKYYEYNNVKMFINDLGISDADSMRDLSDKIKDKYNNSIIVFAAENAGKVILVVSVSSELTKKGLNAGNIIKEVAKVTGGGGGGRPDFAQAGGKNPDKIKEALKLAEEIIKDKVK